MTASFTHELLSGEYVTVVYEFVDEDETVGLSREFEISVYNEFRKDICDDLGKKDTAQIETEVAYRFQRWVDDQRKEADIARWESQLD